MSKSEEVAVTVMPRIGSGLLARGRSSKAVKRGTLYGYLFASPWILGFLFFVAGPLVASAYFSLTDISLMGSYEFIGLQNYAHALNADKEFWPSLGRSFYYVLLTVPLGVLGSLFLAALLNQDVRGKTVFRALFYLPSLTPIVSAVLLWQWILHPSYGVVNYLLSLVGIQGPGWLASQQWAMPALAIMAFWGGVGGSRMLIFLAGLQGVPEELHDAAKIDGANAWQRSRHVTFPMISPTFFFNLVLSLLGALQVFAPGYVGTGGGPGRATWFFSLHIYTNAFQFSRMGYASALAWLFVVVLLAMTGMQFLGSDRWVYYAGGER